MQCPACRFVNRSGRSCCSQCGAVLSIVYPGCGFSNEPGEKFCGGCGRALARHGLGQRDVATMTVLRRIRDEADRIGLRNTFPALDEALAAA